MGIGLIWVLDWYRFFCGFDMDFHKKIRKTFKNEETA